ncbi:Hpt domain-containing protein [Spongiibacter tropicus]|uniref:Hpt domain-containing protein n=1 Tax=Spongiibacter tropicus TaxID=454602 RepID=UPI0003B5B4A2|nr:Hpt domain-containing protein [Spongiibacter tropicus]
MNDHTTARLPVEVLDEAVLEEIFSIMPDDMQILFSSFQQDAELRLQRINDAIDAGDAEELRRSAHTLKGGALGVGAGGYAAQCRAMEELGRNDDLALAPSLLVSLKSDLRGVVAALEQWYAARSVM